MIDREKQIWLEGHYSGLAAATVVGLIESGALPADDGVFQEAFKTAIRDAEWKLLADGAVDKMYDVWRSERYERLVEEYCDGEG